MPIQTINSKGSPSNSVWVIINDPYPQDCDKGYVFSGSYGYIFDQMMRDANLSSYYVTCRRPDVGDHNSFRIIENDLNHYQPPIIITLEDAGKCLLPELNKKLTKASTDDEYESEISKYAGSLLNSSLLNYPHYIIPSFKPDTIARNWKLRDIAVNLELGKAASELDYFKKYKSLEPLPVYDFKTNFEGPEGFALLLYELEQLKSSLLISNDIETTYPNRKSDFYGKNPGYPVLVGLSANSTSAISFELFRDSLAETIQLWRELDYIFRNIQQLGQNFMIFDTNYYEMLGFRFNICPVDTLIRHQVLWPELPHKLAFLTKQYTRQPYYKGMGAGWSKGSLQKYKTYNCLDVASTFKVYEEQELEFNDRPYLR